MRIRCESKKPKKSEAGHRHSYYAGLDVELDQMGADKAIITYPSSSDAEAALKDMQEYCDLAGEVELLTGLQINDKVIVYTDGEEIKSFLSHFMRVPS